jgi:hypothetical protein
MLVTCPEEANFQHHCTRDLILARVFSVLRLGLGNQTRFRSDVLTGKDLGVVTTTATAWSTATGVEIAAADVTTAAWSKTVTFTWSDTSTSSVANTISLTRT